MATVDVSKIKILKALGAATIHEAQGRVGAFDAGIKPIDPGMRVAGPAFTVDSAPADNLMMHYALTRIGRDEVLVIDAKGYLESGVWGDVMTTGAQACGVAGMIIDGAVRDANEMVEADFSVFARGISIKGSGKKQPGQVQVPITCGGITVRPGDIIVGDRDGIVIVDPENVDEVIRLSKAREDNETKLRARLMKGESTYDIMGLDEVLKGVSLKV